MEWQLSQKGEKTAVLFVPIFISIIILLIIIYFSKITDVFIISVITISFFVLIEIFIYFAGTRLNAWNYPLIIKIDDYITILRYDFKQRIYSTVSQPIKIKNIYKIIIKDHMLEIYYTRDDNKKYLTYIELNNFFIRRFSKDLKKRYEILNELLKRINKNRVEIIDKRRRKTLK